MIQTEHNAELTAAIIGEEFISRLNEARVPHLYAVRTTFSLLAAVLDLNETNQNKFVKDMTQLLEKYCNPNQSND